MTIKKKKKPAKKVEQQTTIDVFAVKAHSTICNGSPDIVVTNKGDHTAYVVIAAGPNANLHI